MRRINAKLDEQGNLTYLANDITPLCDFCCVPGETPVAALLVETREFYVEHDRVKRISAGEWYVCRTCLELIFAGDRRSLAHRSIRRSLEEEGLRPERIPLDLMMMAESTMLQIHRQALDQLDGWKWPSTPKEQAMSEKFPPRKGDLDRAALTEQASRVLNDLFPAEAAIHFKWTCEACGTRCTFNEPNQLYENGECFKCGHEQPVAFGGYDVRINVKGGDPMKQ